MKMLLRKFLAVLVWLVCSRVNAATPAEQAAAVKLYPTLTSMQKALLGNSDIASFPDLLAERMKFHGFIGNAKPVIPRVTGNENFTGYHAQASWPGKRDCLYNKELPNWSKDTIYPLYATDRAGQTTGFVVQGLPKHFVGSPQNKNTLDWNGRWQTGMTFWEIDRDGKPINGNRYMFVDTPEGMKIKLVEADSKDTGLLQIGGGTTKCPPPKIASGTAKPSPALAKPVAPKPALAKPSLPKPSFPALTPPKLPGGGTQIQPYLGSGGGRAAGIGAGLRNGGGPMIVLALGEGMLTDLNLDVFDGLMEDIVVDGFDWVVGRNQYVFSKSDQMKCEWARAKENGVRLRLGLAKKFPGSPANLEEYYAMKEKQQEDEARNWRQLNPDKMIDPNGE